MMLNNKINIYHDSMKIFTLYRYYNSKYLLKLKGKKLNDKNVKIVLHNLLFCDLRKNEKSYYEIRRNRNVRYWQLRHDIFYDRNNFRTD